MAVPVLLAQQINYGSASSPFGAVQTQATASSSVTTLGVGWWVVNTGTAESILYSTAATAGVSAGAVYAGPSSHELVWSDGQSWGISTTAGGEGTGGTYFQIKGM